MRVMSDARTNRESFSTTIDRVIVDATLPGSDMWWARCEQNKIIHHIDTVQYLSLNTGTWTIYVQYSDR